MTEEWLRQKIYYCKVNDMLHDAERYECLLSKLLSKNKDEKINFCSDTDDVFVQREGATDGD